METVKIRKSVIDDVDAVMDAHHRSIVELCSKDYDKVQIEAWSSINYDPKAWERTVKDELHLVLEEQARIQGFCHASVHADQVGEIKGLYFSKEIAGRGYGRQAVDLALEYLREQGCKKVVLASTITARPFYEKMGFSCKSERTISIHGVEMVCFSMVMEL